MDDKLFPCPICTFQSEHGAWYLDEVNEPVKKVNCLRCGNYIIDDRTASVIPSRIKTKKERLMFSSYINSLQTDVEVDSKLLDSVNLYSNKPTVDERALLILKSLADKYPEIGTGPSFRDMVTVFPQIGDFTIRDFNDETTKFTLKLMSYSWCNSGRELRYLLSDYLIDSKKYLKKVGGPKETFIISPLGWSRIDELKYAQIESNIGFIAMKFDKELISFSRKWFEKAIIDAGYDPKVMYNHPHISIIDNEMKALIRRSKFIVCDLTNNSRGAYYEAGFAHGLKKPVLFLCETGFFDDKGNELTQDGGGVHFDTNHYPFIKWEVDKGDQLTKKLTDWIEATIGPGLNKTA